MTSVTFRTSKFSRVSVNLDQCHPRVSPAEQQKDKLAPVDEQAKKPSQEEEKGLGEFARKVFHFICNLFLGMDQDKAEALTKTFVDQSQGDNDKDEQRIRAYVELLDLTLLNPKCPNFDDNKKVFQVTYNESEKQYTLKIVADDKSNESNNGSALELKISEVDLFNFEKIKLDNNDLLTITDKIDIACGRTMDLETAKKIGVNIAGYSDHHVMDACKVMFKHQAEIKDGSSFMGLCDFVLNNQKNYSSEEILLACQIVLEKHPKKNINYADENRLEENRLKMAAKVALRLAKENKPVEINAAGLACEFLSNNPDVCRELSLTQVVAKRKEKLSYSLWLLKKTSPGSHDYDQVLNYLLRQGTKLQGADQKVILSSIKECVGKFGVQMFRPQTNLAICKFILSNPNFKDLPDEVLDLMLSLLEKGASDGKPTSEKLDSDSLKKCEDHLLEEYKNNTGFRNKMGERFLHSIKKFSVEGQIVLTKSILNDAAVSVNEKLRLANLLLSNPAAENYKADMKKMAEFILEKVKDSKEGSNVVSFYDPVKSACHFIVTNPDLFGNKKIIVIAKTAKEKFSNIAFDRRTIIGDIRISLKIATATE